MEVRGQTSRCLVLPISTPPARAPRKKACPHQAPPSLLLVSVAPIRAARQPDSQPARLEPGPGSCRVWVVLISCPGQGVPGLPPGRQRPSGLVGSSWAMAVRPASRSRSDPGATTTLLVMSSSQHIQEVSRRARWSHLANESSISTSKGPPPAPAKARLDAMLLLRPCLFPSPPPCSHTLSLTTNC